MLVSFNQPLADLRCFVADKTDRVPRPYRSDVSVGKNFLRRTGVMLERNKLRGNRDDRLADAYPGEGYYCVASAALRFPPGRRWLFSESDLEAALRYRRLFYSGDVVARFDLGVTLERKDATAPALDARRALGIARTLLETRVGVPASAKKPQLRGAGSALAFHMLLATTRAYKKEGDPVPPRWWCRGGFPAMILEYAKGEMTEPAGAELVAVRVPNVVLRHLELKFDDHSVVPVWFLERDGSVSTSLQTEILRRHLLRVHAHREALRSVLWALRMKYISMERDTDVSNGIQDFLNRAQRTINSSGKAVPVDQKQMLDTAYSYEIQLADDPDARELLEELAAARGNVARATRTAVRVSYITNISGGQIGVVNSGSGDATATFREGPGAPAQNPKSGSPPPAAAPSAT